MINVVVSGCNGAMGRVLTKAIEEMEDMTIVAGIDKNINSQMKKGFRLFFLVFSMLLVAIISMVMLRLE